MPTSSPEPWVSAVFASEYYTPRIFQASLPEQTHHAQDIQGTQNSSCCSFPACGKVLCYLKISLSACSHHAL